ncbi:MAG: dihydropteroate synthase [Chitinophagaceae bacterium]
MFTLNCKGRLLTIDKPVVMGIINVTPDSFYAGSRQPGPDNILQAAEKMLEEGATLLDIGGQSTRPGSLRMTAEEELKRVIGPVARIAARFPEAFISIDTFYSRVAREAVQAGAVVVNDISAGALDEAMISTVSALGVPYVLMHMKGSPQTMQAQAVYENVTKEVLDFLIQKTGELRQAGIKDIIIDPGFGFAKTAPHNFELLRGLDAFRLLQCPVLLGLSRKSFIWKTLGVTPADKEALTGTIALNMAGLLNGASILRVHDVKEAAETIRLFNALQE